MKVQFTQDFYKHLAEVIMDGFGEVEYDDESDGYPDTFYVDGYEVSATIYYRWSLHDESFDHAFGTWHDPCPYMEIEGFDDIDRVNVYDEDTGEEIEGFDYDSFMEQFEEPTWSFSSHSIDKGFHTVRVKRGDKVLYYGKEVTFLAKNTENGRIKVLTDKGTFYSDTQFIKAI